MNIKIDEAILHIHPGAEFVIYDNDLNKLTFLKPADLTVTQEQVDAALVELEQIRQAEAEAKAAQRQAILDRLGLTSEEARLLLS